MKRRFVIVGIIISVVVLIGIGIFVILSRVPQMSDQVQQGTSSVHVSLLAPENPGTWPLDSFIPVLVSAEGNQPIQTLELFINGVLYATKTAPQDWAGKFLATHWTWQPGSAGQFTLVAYATDALGQTGISSPVVIIAKASTGPRTAIQAMTGDTLQVIAIKNNVPLPDIQNVNPGVDPATLLEPGLQIYLPNPPATIQDLVSIPAYVLPGPIQGLGLEGTGQSGSGEGNGGNNPQIITPIPIPPEEPQSNPSGLSSSLMDNLSFLLEGQNGSKVELPLTPEISGDFSGCTAKIYFKAHAFEDIYDIWTDGGYDYLRPKAEDGFFLYKSQDGGPWERIATWAKIGKDSSDEFKYESPQLFPDQYGQVSYYLSAFNTAGESPSAPVTLPFDPNQCKAPASRGSSGLGKVSMDNGNLILPYSMDLAYFYLKINNSRGFRVPEGGRSFLPASGVQFNIFDYLNTVVEKYPQPDLDLSMEVWGWSGGKLVSVGTFKTAVHRAVLMVCSVEGEGGCTGGGGGHWVTETNISPDKPIKDQIFEMRWQTTSLTEVQQVCDQLAALPYPDDNYWTQDLLISAGCRWQNTQGHEGTYQVNLGLLFPTGSKSGGEFGTGMQGSFEFDSNWFQFNYPEGTPFSLYSRFVPHLKMSGYNRFSNTVALHYNTPKELSGLPPLASTYPSIYDVQILRDDYVAPIFESDANWGCVIVDEDPSPVPPQICTMGVCVTVGTPPHQPGEKICPTPMQHTQDCGNLLCLIEAFGKGLGQLYDLVAYGMDAYFKEVGSGLASLIPGCSSSPNCISITTSAVKIGFTALTGMPTSLPNFGEFVSGNVVPAVMDEMMGDETVSTVYKACPACKKAVEDSLTTQLEQYASLQSQFACINAYDAMLKGLEPLCLDPNIKVHPAPGSGNFYGGVLVKITRRTTAESLAVTQADADKYQLSLTVVAKNPSVTTYPEYSIYQDVLVKIPWMQPGESKVVAVSLTPCFDHDPNYCGAGEAWDAIKPIFYGGSTNMLATEKCYSADSSWPWVPCTNGGQDQWEFDNPAVEGQ